MLAQELTAEIAKSREIDSLTPRALEIFREMIDEFSVGIPAENSEECKQNATDAVLASAKEGIGIEDILEAVVKRVPPPKTLSQVPLRALIFDSWFDPYQGVVILVRLVEGQIKPGQKIQLMSVGKDFEVLKVGAFMPFAQQLGELKSGEVGFVIAGIKDVHDTKIGDTVTDAKNPSKEMLKGFKLVKPMVFSGIFPVDGPDYENLRDALEKLALNDSSFTFEPETSLALGFGFRCGFLGLLHMEIIQERLEREYNLNLITTAPSVVYRVTETNGTVTEIENPADLPQVTKIAKFEEPIITATIHCPTEFIGGILKLCEDKRGVQKKLEYVTSTKAIIVYELPLNEVVMDFYDRLKSISKGYASLDYEFTEFRESQLVKLDILLNAEPVDALSLIVHESKAVTRGRKLTEKIKELLNRQQFQIAIQAAIGAKVIARETLGALRKDVTAKCYGGDITRKRKLLEKQKEGKKRLKQIGTVELPQEAFLAILKVEE
jgi:GTP-binding protein LepA